MNPLIDKSSFLGRSTEKTRVWSKASHCGLIDMDQHFLRIEKIKKDEKDKDKEREREKKKIQIVKHIDHNFQVNFKRTIQPIYNKPAIGVITE